MKNDFSLWKINYVILRVKEYMSIRDKLQNFVYLWLTTFKSKRSISSVLKKVDKWKNNLLAFKLLFPSFLINIFGLKLNLKKRNIDIKFN